MNEKEREARRKEREEAIRLVVESVGHLGELFRQLGENLNAVCADMSRRMKERP